MNLDWIQRGDCYPDDVITIIEKLTRNPKRGTIYARGKYVVLRRSAYEGSLPLQKNMTIRHQPISRLSYFERDFHTHLFAAINVFDVREAAIVDASAAKPGHPISRHLNIGCKVQ